jgi:hypothetical protein
MTERVGVTAAAHLRPVPGCLIPVGMIVGRGNPTPAPTKWRKRKTL